MGNREFILYIFTDSRNKEHKNKYTHTHRR